MNSLLIAFAVYFSLVMLLLVLDPFKGKHKRLADLGERLRSRLFYNLIIEIMTESYCIIAVCCMIGLNKLSLNNIGEKIQSASCIFALLVLIGYPVLIFWVLLKAWNSEDLPET
jgi:hypothetical protein